MADPIVLTEPQRAELLAVFRRHSPPVGRVDVFGSRASGSARPGADIDLLIRGAVDWRTKARIHAELEESYLSIQADLKVLDELVPGGFRDTVLATARPLFTEDDLRVTDG